ncbi:MAG: phage baseplate protein, partial [bacterium]
KLAGTLLQKPAQTGVQTTPPQDSSPIKIKSAYQLFEQIYENRLPVMIITGLVAYDNMVMESLSMPRNQGTTRSLPFTASFRRVNFAWSEVVTIPAMADQATADRATPKKSQGNQSTSDPGDKAKEKGESLLYKLIGALGLY